MVQPHNVLRACAGYRLVAACRREKAKARESKTEREKAGVAWSGRGQETGAETARATEVEGPC